MDPLVFRSDRLPGYWEQQFISQLPEVLQLRRSPYAAGYFFVLVIGDYLDRHACLLYTSDAADERSSVDLGGRRIIKKKKRENNDATSELIQKTVDEHIELEIHSYSKRYIVRATQHQRQTQIKK